MHIALVQLSICDQSRSANSRHAAKMIELAANANPPPGVIVLPAGTNGVSPQQWTTDMFMIETHVEPLAACARDLGVSVVLGYSEPHGNKLYDSVAWIDADGDVLACNRRRNFEAHEEGLWQSGTTPKVHKTIFGPVAVVAGVDVLDNDCLSQLASDQARIVIASCAWSAPQLHCERLCDLAQTHGLWICMSNRAGRDAYGHSRIIAPSGKITCALDDSTESIIQSEVDLEHSIQ